jgi:hypothetical protein
MSNTPTGNTPTDGQHRGPATTATPDPTLTSNDPMLARIGDALRGLRYGSVLAIVQDGVVVQIERTEKTRLAKSDRS